MLVVRKFVDINNVNIGTTQDQLLVLAYFSARIYAAILPPCLGPRQNDTVWWLTLKAEVCMLNH